MLSYCYYLLFIVLLMVLLRSLNLRRYLGNFVYCINIFQKSVPLNTTINLSELDHV